MLFELISLYLYVISKITQDTLYLGRFIIGLIIILLLFFFFNLECLNERYVYTCISINFREHVTLY